jgi:hypothetical protein
MYNFRYHLITICSIFIALAVGLLLGAAITGSDLVRDTSNDMLDSLLTRFDETEGRNAELAAALEAEQGFNVTLFDGWKAGRLTGRTVVILTDTATTGGGLTTSVSETVSGAGANPVRVTVLKSGLGLGDEATLGELQTVLPAVEGSDYAGTVADALVAEWTTSFTSLAALQAANTAAAANNDGTVAEADAEAETTEGTGDEQPSDTPPTSIAGITPSTAFEEMVLERYPVTLKLIELDCIEIDTDYRALIERAEAEGAALQTQLWTLLDTWQLPYTANALVGMAIDPGQETPTPDASVALIAERFVAKGNDGSLPYPAILDNSSGSTEPLGAETTLNYFALLLQEEGQAAGFIAAAQEHGLSCITTPRVRTGQYGIIALLSGSQKGIYGEDQGEDATYPPLPGDQNGLAPFIG